MFLLRSIGAMGYQRLDTLTGFAKAGYWVRLRCPCGHEARHDPMKLVMLLNGRGAPTQLRRLGETLKCGKCGGRDFDATHCEGPLVTSR